MPHETDYAVVIGIQHYVENTELGGPHQDTLDLVHWLTDSTGGNIPPENIGKFLSTPTYEPTQTEVDRWFNKTFKAIGAGKRGRRLYFYFSGHGIGVNAMNSAMLLPEWSLSMRNFALSSEKYLLQLVNKGIFEEIFFFMDCCRNRIAGVEGQPPLWGSAAPSNASCEYLLYYASEFDNPAYESSLNGTDTGLDNQLPRGLFTKVLLNGLKGAASDRNGQLRVQDLVNYIKRELPSLAKSVGKTQIPRPKIEIDLEKEIAGPFNILLEVSITFKTAGLNMILEGPDLEVEKSGSSTDGQWDVKLKRGRKYMLRKEKDTDGLLISIDGTQTAFTYE